MILSIIQNCAALANRRDTLSVGSNMMTKQVKQWVMCSKCGTFDASYKAKFGVGVMLYPAHIGTANTMRCSDCCTPPSVIAGMCRNCCPTGHATRSGPTSLDDMIAAGIVRRARNCYEGQASDGVWLQIGNDREDTEHYLENNPTPETW